LKEYKSAIIFTACANTLIIYILNKYSISPVTLDEPHYVKIRWRSNKHQLL